MSRAEQDAWVREPLPIVDEADPCGPSSSKPGSCVDETAHSTADLPAITAKVQDQGETYVKQHQAGSMDNLIRANNNTMRMELQANQFTALSARGLK